MLRIFVSVLLVYTGTKSVASDQQFSCKPIPGCQVSGCDPAQSDLQQNEVLVTCQPGNPRSGISTINNSAESESLTQKVQDLERLRDELIDTVNTVRDKSKKMESDIAEMKSMLRDLMQKNKDLIEERAFDHARISLLEAHARIKAGTLDPTPTITSKNGTTPETPTDRFTWGEWKWSSCSVSCGTGRRIVTRLCYNSLGDSVSTSLCSGGYRSSIANAGPCNTSPCSSYGSSWGVHVVGVQSQEEGAYSWGKWTQSSCSLECGGGTTSFSRSCWNNRGGYSSTSSRCPGGYRNSFAFSGPCNTQPCAVHYHFWGEWASSSCSATCGLGTRKKQRECFNYKHRRVVASPDLCTGSDTEEENCLMELCENETTTASPTTQEISTTAADLYSWGEWRQSACSASCGNGTSTFTRSCLTQFGSQAFSINSCTGGFRASYARSGPCNTQPCVVNYHTWSQWTQSPCSTTCGLGTQKRRRECWTSYYNRTVVSDHLCGGTSQDEFSCMLGLCGGDATAALPTTTGMSQGILSTQSTESSWGEWTQSPCSASCGWGTTTRRRSCLNFGFSVSSSRCSGGFRAGVAGSSPCFTRPCPEETTAATTTSPSLSSSSSTASIGGVGIMDHIRNVLQRAFTGIIFECDFDTANDTCGMINDNRSNADWMQKQNTSSANDGYLVLDASTVSSRRIVAKITTPRFRNTGPSCMSFRFFMTSSATATLKVTGRVISTEGRETATTMRIPASISTNTNSWMQREVDLFVVGDPKYISVELEAAFNVDPTLSNPTIAVDDLAIKPSCG